MKMRLIGLICCVAALLAGCAHNAPKKFYLDNAPITDQELTGSRDIILFPDYFLMDEFELQDHGHIPRTHLIGAGMTAKLPLVDVRSRFNDQLFAHQWNTDTMEMGRQSFRIMASHEGETVEIRGVQGSSGPTHVFLLYTPKPD